MSRLHRFFLVLAIVFFLWNCFVWSEDKKQETAPAKPTSAAEIDRLIKQLGSDAFNEREKASKALEDIGEPALEALRKAANKRDDAEVRCRAEKLVKALAASLYRELRSFKGHTDSIYGVAFSPDGKRALSGSDDKTLRLWDVATGTELCRFTGHTGEVESVAFSPDGKWALSGSKDETMRLWDAQTGKELRRFTGHTSSLISIAFSPDGKRALSGSGDGTARLWDVETGKELCRFTSHTSNVMSVVFCPDGKRAISGSVDMTVRLWDTESGKELRRFTGHTSPVYGVALSPDGKRMLSGGADHTVRLWDVETGKELRRFTGHIGFVTSVAFSPDGKWLLSSSSDGRGDGATRAPPPDRDDTVRLWDVETGEELHRFEGHTSRVESVTFSPDGKRALSGSNDKTLRLWQLSAEPASAKGVGPAKEK